MEPRCFHPVRHVVLWALPLVIALAGCADRELPTAPPAAPSSRSLAVAGEGSRAVAVDAYNFHSCSLTAVGSVACWGSSSFGATTPPAGTFTDVSVGAGYSCGVKTDGTVACWGGNTLGQASPPTGGFTRVSSGLAHSCGLKDDGSLACWGSNDDGQATPPTGAFIQVTAGLAHSCALKGDGTAVCWGNDGSGRSTPPPGTFVQVDAGDAHTCGVKTDATVVCWGNNGNGQSTPPSGTFKQVSAGRFHTCGVKTGGTVACWGSNDDGMATPPAGAFVQVSAGRAYTCGVKSDGAIACWGDNASGRAAPPNVAHTMPGVDAGGIHTCALISDGTVACWGSFGNGLMTPPPGTFTQVSGGSNHTCGVANDGTVVCWGNNDFGKATPPAGTFTQVSAGTSHTCGVRTDGTAACWGGDFAGESTPPAETLTQLSAGQSHTCGVMSDRTVACWGSDFSGQSTPPAGTFRQVSAGAVHTCGLKTDGTLACWGANGSLQAAPPVGTFTQVSAGTSHTCGLKTDGTIACWGANISGQATPPAGTFVQVSAGSFHTCAVKGAGGVVCWGFDHAGQSTVPPELAGVTATLTILTVTPSTQQYSDKVALTASTFPAAAAGSVQFKKSVDGGATFVDLGAPVVAPASLADHQILQAAGTGVQFKAVFTPTGDYTESTSDAKALTVTKESATIVYLGTNVAALQVASPGGSLAASGLTLALQVKETSPDLAAATAGLGAIANAGLSVRLAAVGAGGSYDLTCTPGAVSGSGYAAIRAFSCTNPAAVAVNVYEVLAEVTGDYYTGSYSDAFTVFDPSLGFATGGGTFLLGTDKVNFGFTMKYNKSGTNLQGNLIAMRHHPDGTVSRLKSTALAGLALGEDAAVPMGWASFTGKANYTTWDATANGAAGAYVTVGNQSFTVYAEDRNNPGTGVDRIWLDAPGTLAMPGTLATAKTNTAELTGGGIGVPHKATKK